MLLSLFLPTTGAFDEKGCSVMSVQANTAGCYSSRCMQQAACTGLSATGAIPDLTAWKDCTGVWHVPQTR